jgi:uncharacterized repeat protein (TIGR03803 family)
MRSMVLSALALLCLATMTVAPGQSRAANLTTLVSFCALANCADGANPRGGLIADAKDNLFGTTTWGGANNAGTVFEIAKTAKGYASSPTILVSFCALTNCADGAFPVATLVADANGNLFGTTTLGGAGGNYNFGGTVFEIAKTAGSYASTPTTLVSFCVLANCADGANPNSLTADANDNLFGTTVHGGAGVGTVFEIAKTANGYASTATILSSFEFGITGASPSGLITDKNGNLFGVTGGFKGTVFEIGKTASGYASLITLVRVCSLAPPSCADGSHPAAVIADANDNLFGTTQTGGGYAYGTVFEIAKTAGGYASTPAILVSFNSSDGATPEAGLIADGNGNLFGTTTFGGANDSGSVFEITGSGFAVPVIFAGAPGKANCHGKCVSALARQYGGLTGAAAALGYASTQALQNAIEAFCGE